MLVLVVALKSLATHSAHLASFFKWAPKCQLLWFIVFNIENEVSKYKDTMIYTPSSFC